MGAAGLVAALAGRPASRVYALGLAAAVTLALNPYAAGDVGWQLSFAAVVGPAGAGARRSRERLARGWPAPLAEAAAMTLAATRRDGAAAGRALRPRVARLAAGEPARRARRRADHVARDARARRSRRSTRRSRRR